MSIRTASQARDTLAEAGVSVSQWATTHGLSVLTVYGLLSGRRKGTRGEAHRAAVLLGLKDGTVTVPSAVKDVLCSASERDAA